MFSGFNSVLRPGPLKSTKERFITEKGSGSTVLFHDQQRDLNTASLVTRPVHRTKGREIKCKFKCKLRNRNLVKMSVTMWKNVRQFFNFTEVSCQNDNHKERTKFLFNKFGKIEDADNVTKSNTEDSEDIRELHNWLRDVSSA